MDWWKNYLPEIYEKLNKSGSWKKNYFTEKLTNLSYIWIFANNNTNLFFPDAHAISLVSILVSFIYLNTVKAA